MTDEQDLTLARWLADAGITLYPWQARLLAAAGLGDGLPDAIKLTGRPLKGRELDEVPPVDPARVGFTAGYQDNDPDRLVVDVLEDGAVYRMGPALEGGVVTLVGDPARVVGHVEDGLVVITDPRALSVLRRGMAMGLSVRPLPPADWSVVDSWLAGGE